MVKNFIKSLQGIWKQLSKIIMLVYIILFLVSKHELSIRDVLFFITVLMFYCTNNILDVIEEIVKIKKQDK